jgi:outer membrane protein insertion porin family
VIVNVDVVEGNTGSLAAGGGISSNAGLFGTVSYQQRNFGGNNQTLGAEFQLGEREFLFDLSFSDPWIATDNFRTSYTVNVFRRQSISLVYDGENSSIRTLNDNDSPRIVRTGGGITFVRPLAPDVFTKPKWVLSLGFNYQQVQVQNANGDISPVSAPLHGFGSQQLAFSSSGIDDLLSLNIGAIRDFRDNPLQPTSGSFLRLGLEQTVPVGSGSIFGTRVRGSYSYFIPVRFINSFNLFETDIFKGQQSLAFNAQAGTVLGDLPPYDAFIVGGSNSVRGYAEGEVGSGRSYFQATAEYRFPIVAIIGGALFVDFGTTVGSQGDVPGQPGIVRDLPGTGLGYGLGVRVQSPVGQIRVDYGFNVDGGSRLHFGIGERF